MNNFEKSSAGKNPFRKWSGRKQNIQNRSLIASNVYAPVDINTVITLIAKTIFINKCTVEIKSSDSN